MYLLFVADAILHGDGAKDWDIPRLINHIYLRLEQQWKGVLPEDKKDYLSYLKEMILYATACKGWSVEKEVKYPFNKSVEKLMELKELLYSVLASVNLDGGSDLSIHPLEPDVLGEFFVLSELLVVIHPSLRKSMVDALWSQLDSYYEFLYRCCQTYCNEEVFCKIFGEGFKFMEPDSSLGEECILLYAKLLCSLTVFLTDGKKREQVIDQLANC